MTLMAKDPIVYKYVTLRFPIPKIETILVEFYQELLPLFRDFVKLNQCEEYAHVYNPCKDKGISFYFIHWNMSDDLINCKYFMLTNAILFRFTASLRNPERGIAL